MLTPSGNHKRDAMFYGDLKHNIEGNLKHIIQNRAYTYSCVIPSGTDKDIRCYGTLRIGGEVIALFRQFQC